ncbi:hypothetical protein [Raineyella fluvialis]|uniref:hypothetical protein n=1 Tax=Raineyella fluvialis TaxID=2662261 RepID=UPI0030D4E4E2
MNGDQRYRWEQRVRGLMLGLALGEAIGGLRGEVAQCERLWAGVATQLAAFTAEGLIRADVRRRLHGSCNRNWVLWHAYSRWAALQHIATAASAYWGSKSAGEWPDGWLAHIPELAENRGPQRQRSWRSSRTGPARPSVRSRTTPDAMP